VEQVQLMVRANMSKMDMSKTDTGQLLDRLNKCRADILNAYENYEAIKTASDPPSVRDNFLKELVVHNEYLDSMSAEVDRRAAACDKIKSHPNHNDLVGPLCSEWNRRTSCSTTTSQSTATGEGKKEHEELHIVFSDEWNREGCKMTIGLSMQLKKLFNDYAEVENKSLRSLRFSHEGRTLFLSSVGNKTPKDLGMENHATIIVTDLTKTNEEDDAPTKASPNRSNRNKKRNKRTQKKASRPRKQQPVIEKTIEELKIEHSKILGKLHEEAQSQLKLIRQRLNNLLIERNPPKVKVKVEVEVKSAIVDNPPSEGSGKAGKSHYVVQVGEVTNLYKTSKHRTPGHNHQKLLQLDLHGFTKEDALNALNDSLPQWNGIAMSGSYPFVVPVEIICGCGSQILSEVVEQWIKCNDQVANAPKSRKK